LIKWMPCRWVVLLFLAVMVCVACVFAGLTFKITSSLLSYTAVKIKEAPRGYFVTYMIVKDHDFRNEHLKIPHMERIRQGYEFRYGSELLLFETTKRQSWHRLT